MRKIILSLAIACISGLTAHAQLNGDGYYRIQNVNTGRYMTLSDRHSRGVNGHTSNVDAGALATRKKWSDIEDDPGSVFYIQKVNDSEYNILAQGIDMHQLIDYYVKITAKSTDTYYLWQTSSGTRLYLSDENENYKGEDSSFVKTKGSDTREWKITPLDNSTSNYLGIAPLVKANNGKYYATYIAGFPFSLQSSGMKAYTLPVYNTGAGMIGYKEITGDIPSGTPVLIECSSASAKGNLIQPLTSTSNQVSGANVLTGVYFCLADWVSGHYNYEEFDAKTMRTLGVNAAGELVFNNSAEYMSSVYVFTETTDAYYTAIPHNTAYIKVSETAPAELKVTDYNTAGIKDAIIYQQDAPGDIYTLAGVKVRKDATSTEGLPQGIYIFKGKKVVVK